MAKALTAARIAPPPRGAHDADIIFAQLDRLDWHRRLGQLIQGVLVGTIRFVAIADRVVGSR